MIKYFLILTSLISYSVEIPGEEILNVFSSTCETGNLGNQALEDSKKLTQLVSSINNDPDCVSLAGELSLISNLQSDIGLLSNKYSLRSRFDQLVAQENEIFSQIGVNQDPIWESSLVSFLSQVQIEKSSVLSQIRSQDDFYEEDSSNLYQKIISVTESSLRSISNNQKCLKRNPRIASSLTSLSTAVASTIALQNPALSIGLSATSEFIGQLTEGIRSFGFNNKIRKITNNTTWASANMCVLESLTNRWCDVLDAQNILDLQKKYRNTDKSFSEDQFAKIQTRDIPIFFSWLNSVRSGVPASNSADAERQKQINSKRIALDSFQALGDGVKGEIEPQLIGIVDNNRRYQLIRKAIERLTGVDCTGGARVIGFNSEVNPLAEIYNNVFAPFYLLGLSDIPIDQSTGGQSRFNFCFFDPNLPGHWPLNLSPYDFDLNKVIDRFEAWIDLARDLVDREFFLVVQPDSLGVFASAFRKYNNLQKISPRDALENIVLYLSQKNILENDLDIFKNLASNTIENLNKILKILDESSNISDNEEALVKLKDIFDISSLQYGSVVLKSRVQMLVGVAIQEYLLSLNIKERSKFSQFLAANSFFDVLVQIENTENFQVLSERFDLAKSATYANIENYLSIFGKEINLILKNYSKDKIYDYQRSKLCLLLASAPKWNKKIDMKYCFGTQMKSVFEDLGPQAPKFTAKFVTSEINKRECSLRNFRRQSLIYQQWGI